MNTQSGITLYAQPYDISAHGFYFTDHADYAAKAATARNAYGQPVAEFEIQFIDGSGVDGKGKPHPVFSGGLNSSNMLCFEARGMNFYGYAYACD